MEKARNDINKHLNRKAVSEIIAHAEGNRRVPLQTIILGTLYVSGALATMVLAPNVVRLFEYLDPISRRNTIRFNQRITQALLRLERRGLIHVEGEGRRRHVTITDKGEKVVDALYAESYIIPRPFRWDGKWRLVMFDVPEKRKRMRETLRLLLKNAGFVHFQDSAWIQPYPCDELVTLLRAHLESGKGEVRYLAVQFVDESDYTLRKHFNLTT